MKTHFVTLLLRADSDAPLLPAGMFLIDPVSGVMDSSSVIPLTIFEQIEEAVRAGKGKGAVRAKTASGDWRISRMVSMDEVCRWHGEAVAAASGLVIAYRGFLGREVGLVLEGPGGSFRVPIEDARHLIARHAVTQAPAEIVLHESIAA